MTPLEELLADLTQYELDVLLRVMGDTHLTREGNGPWRQGWRKPRTSAESNACARLHRRGLLHVQPGRPSSKLGPSYRWREQVSRRR